MFGWRVFYGDGRTIDDDECKVEDLPRRDVQAVIVADDAHGWRILRIFDFYVFDDVHADGWKGTDVFGLWDYLTEPRETCVVLFGRTIGEREYLDIVNRALADASLPTKTGHRRGERRPDDVGKGPGR